MYLNIPAENFQLHFEQYRGIAILISCDYSRKSDLELPTTKQNADEMRKTFQLLGYDIHERQNETATKREVMELLKDLSGYLSGYKEPLTNPDGREKVIAFAFSGRGGPDESAYTAVDKDSMSLLTWDEQNLSLKGEVMPLIVSNQHVYKIPKLFFIDASRGKEDLSKAMDMYKASVEDEGNYRIDYATIPDHQTSPDSNWMSELACKLRDVTMKNESLQNIAAHVKRSVQEQDSSGTRQCDSIDRLVTGPLYLHPAAEYRVPA